MKNRSLAKSSMVAVRMWDGEMMIMSAVDSTFFTLNHVAAVIWRAADGRRCLADIIKCEVCAEFEVEPGIALEDAEAFTSELISHGIFSLSEPRELDYQSQYEPTIPHAPKKPYQKPSFRSERAFETMALSCGKVSPIQFQCKFNLKNS